MMRCTDITLHTLLDCIHIFYFIGAVRPFESCALFAVVLCYGCINSPMASITVSVLIFEMHQALGRIHL